MAARSEAQGRLYLEPALFVDTRNAMRINREEIFGPVASVLAVGCDEALQLPTTPRSDFGGHVTSSPSTRRTSAATARPAW
jgi:aldehyde dehydrogenase (NAD+)